MLKTILPLFVLLSISCVFSQNNKIIIKAQLFAKTHTVSINQSIIYYNKSKDTLNKIVLRNWGNSYRDAKTPLAKRLLTDYKTDFYFSKKKDRGYTTINSIETEQQQVKHHIPKKQKDLIFVTLSNGLKPNDSITLNLKYQLKIPNAKFTGNGKKGVDYFLKNWYISPSQYHQKWVLDTHQNLDYQYNPPTDYKIDFNIPAGYKIYSHFDQIRSKNNEGTHYQLKGNHFTNADLDIIFFKTYANIVTDATTVITDFISPDIDIALQKEKTQQMLRFLQKHLGKLHTKQLLVTKQTYNQHSIYELKYIPKILHPFKSEFIWEITFFKTLLYDYTTQGFTHNKNTQYWFTEGLQTYLFIKYLNQYYPNSKLLGYLANVWGIRTMNIAKSKFIDKFAIMHQITARENLDQSLNTPLKKLSNYNKKIITPYKAGLGFVFLESFVDKQTFLKTLKKYATNSKNLNSSPTDFIKLLEKESGKNLNWFQTEWLNTSKKIDHKITKAIFKKDSIYIQLKNKRSIKTPVAVYGLKNDTIKSKTWVAGFSDTKKVTIQNKGIDQIVLNYQNNYPEINNRNNYKNKQFTLFNRPLQLSLFKDLNNSRATQFFVSPAASYNYYDGVILGLGVQNKAYIRKNFEYQINPTYSTKSNTFTGGFHFNYSVFPEKTAFYRINIGLNGSNYHYQENLNYNSLSPYLSLSFKQKDFRALGTNQITARFVSIDKEIPTNAIKTDEDQYRLYKVNYLYVKNQLIHNYQINLSTEVADAFTKLSADFRYRHLTSKKIPIEFRFFGGLFLNNQTTHDYFSFNQHTPNDYLFELPYLGRSETTGILTQQYFKAQGGFVTQNGSGFSNQWLTSINSSIGIWRWIETFHNVSLLKNKSTKAVVDYEGGIRLNFVPNLLEFYFPIYNKTGFVTNNKEYLKTIRFSVILKAQPIIKFLKQQLF